MEFSNWANVKVFDLILFNQKMFGSYNALLNEERKTIQFKQCVLNICQTCQK